MSAWPSGGVGDLEFDTREGVARIQCRRKGPSEMSGEVGGESVKILFPGSAEHAVVVLNDDRRLVNIIHSDTLLTVVI